MYKQNYIAVKKTLKCLFLPPSQLFLTNYPKVQFMLANQINSNFFAYILKNCA